MEDGPGDGCLVFECRGPGVVVGCWAGGERSEGVEGGATEGWGVEGWRKGGRDQSSAAWQLTPALLFLKYSLLKTDGLFSSLHPTDFKRGHTLKEDMRVCLLKGCEQSDNALLSYTFIPFFSWIKASIGMMSAFEHFWGSTLWKAQYHPLSF